MQNSAYEHVTRIRCKKYGLDKHGNLNGENPLASDLKDSIDHLAQGLYTRNAHFIFELIQNAEDNTYGNNIEPSLTFKLLQDDPTNTPGADGVIIVENNEVGFSPENIDAICAVGKSTKKKQEGFIGEKGIGFKSIFRVTSNPFLFSNGYQISLPKNHKQTGLGFIVPEWVENIPQIINTSRTSIILPLDQPDFGYDVVKKMLWEIEPETILFLTKLNEIKIVTDRGEGFTVIKDDSSKPNIQLLTNKNGCDEIFEFLLSKNIFIKPNDINHEKRIDIKEREVSIAFPVGEKPNSTGKLFAYLPVRYDTGFPFIINADFILSSSREDIQDTPWNREWLMPCVGTLVSTSLPILKDNKKLSISFLNSLAKSVLLLDEYHMYYPIAKAVEEAFTTLELIPADDGSFIFAENAKLASADWLRKLLREEQLKLLYKKEKKWVHGDITDNVQRELWKYFREEIKIEEMTPDGFARKLDSDFLSIQSDQWIIDFYAQLPNQQKLWRKRPNRLDPDGPLRKKPFIRLQNGTHVRPFDDNEQPNVYLTTKTFKDAQVATVKTEIACQDEARRFLLSDLKIPEFDIVAEVIEHVIPKFTSQNLPKTDEHARYIDKIILAFQTDSHEKKKRLKDALQKTPFILSRSLVSSDEAYRRADVLYFQNELLKIYFSENPGVAFVSSCYQKSALNFFAELGVSSEIRIKCKTWTSSQDYIELEYQSGYRRGLKGFDPDICVEGLSHALLNPSIEKSQIIWNKICLPYKRCIKGKISRSSRHNFSSKAKTNIEEEVISEEFGKLLINSSWLPTKNNGFKKPTDLSLDELPDQFERDEKLADLLGMIKTENVDAVDILVKGDHEKKELLELLLNAPNDKLREVRKILEPRAVLPPPAPSFREGLANMCRRQQENFSSNFQNSEEGHDFSVRNPEHYQNNLDDAVIDGVEEHTTTPNAVHFSLVRKKPDNKESREFLYIEYQGKCQISSTTFPKSVANSEGIPENYFEACCFLPYSNACYLNDAGNMLCVSADTMAKLKYANFEWLDNIEDIIAEFEKGGSKAPRIKIRIKLAGEESVITWSQRHFMRLISLYKHA